MFKDYRNNNMKTKQKEIGLVVNFSIEIEPDQGLLYFYQQKPIAREYEINIKKAFDTDYDDKIDSEEIDDFIREQCIDYIYNKSNVGMIVSGIEYSINLDKVEISLMH